MSGSFTRKNKIFSPVIYLALLLLPFSLSAQKSDKKELENKKKKLHNDIEYTNKLLIETRNNKKLSLNQLVTLKIKISAREELISTINNEIGLISKEVNENTATVQSLQKQLKKLKEDYAKMIYHAYRHQDSYSKLAFVFAARDFEQAYLRLKYLQQYGDYRHKQAKMIENTQLQLNGKIQELEQKKSEKRMLLVHEESEKQNLNQEKSQKEEVLTKLQDKEKQLKKDLEKKKKDAAKLQAAIQKAIADEIALREAEDARIKVKDPKSTPKKFELRTEVIELSNSFSSNKGKLPFPVLQGIVVEHFGIRAHPTLPSVEISNNGINISTTKGAVARAVFDGQVTRTGNIPGAGKYVIIRHGEYLSVYMNLQEVYVNPGDKIKTKQNLGTVIYDDEEGKTELHLEIWKGQTKLDPETWLYKGN